MRMYLVGTMALALLAGSAIGAVAQSDEPGPVADGALVDELFSVTLGDDAIPEDLAGILFFNKLYPADMDITYGPDFVAPNTFVRYVEAGELGIRPNSDVLVMRAGPEGAGPEAILAGEETVVAQGDSFVMTDIPYEEFGPEALGEMWTPAGDAEVVGFAIRETSRCCKMSHSGMISPWYVTLSGSTVEEMRGQPVTLRVLRWDLSPGTSLPLSAETGAMMRFVEEGVVTASKVAGETASPSDEEPFTVDFRAGATIYPLSLDPGQMVAFSNGGDESALVYELRLEPALLTGSAVGVAGQSEDPLGYVASKIDRMAKSRSDHSATLLPDGRVLITGGGWADAELFDPDTGTFEPAGKMAKIRSATATLLLDGRVLLAGGRDPVAELWDPATRTFEPTGELSGPRDGHTGTLLSDGRVLIAGGESSSAETYDPSTGTFEPTGDLSHWRRGHAATRLPDGRVLITGGGIAEAELYDPASGTFETTGSMADSRPHHTATLLAEGRVLLAAGSTDSAEVYDPATGVFEVTGPLAERREDHTATLLPDGRVLVTGGLSHDPFGVLHTAEIYDPSTGTFSETGPMSRARLHHTATLLPDGRVLIAGGSTLQASMAGAEIYEPVPAE